MGRKIRNLHVIKKLAVGEHDIRHDPSAGFIMSIVDKDSGRELVDISAAHGFNEYIYDRYTSAPTFNHLSGRVEALDLSLLGERSVGRYAAVVERTSNAVIESVKLRMVVTGAEGTMLTELAGRSPLTRIRELAEQLDPDDRELAARGLHLGLVVDEHRVDFGRGDFVVRNVIGAETDTGSLAVGEQLALGSIVQFQVRDPASAEAELARLLKDAGPAAAALVFTCVGRGAALFGEPHHDATAVADVSGAGALAGMFCTAELGPIAGMSKVHTYSAAVALFGGAGPGAGRDG